MAKLVSTHVMLGGLGTLHVKGSRTAVLRTFYIANLQNEIGVDLPIYVRRAPADPYQLSQLWVGISIIRKAFVADEHEIEGSDEPFTPTNEDDMLTATAAVSDDLVVTL